MRPAAVWTLATLLGFVAIEALLFRTGWYYRYLEPSSSAGQVEAYLRWLTRRSSTPEVLVLGDSRVHHGLSAPVADAAVGGKLHFWNFGIAGTLPRDWYYMLRDADP